ncbi:MAG: polysaccharide biosynthesis transport protein [Verrucomicrobiota bacterium]|jgi:capsular exopolysaccharide synthesis family protein
MEATKNFDAPEIKLHFLDYWRIIRIRKTVILAVFLLVAITTTLVTFILPPKYASTVRIAVEKDGSDIDSISGPRNSGGFDPFWVQTQFEKIQSKLVLYQVISNLDLAKRWGEKYKAGELTLPIAYNFLKRDLSVSQSRNTTLIEIKVESDIPAEASEIANKIADVYRATRLERWTKLSTIGLAKLEEEMEQHNRTISNLNSRLDKMRQDLGISDLEASDSRSKSIEQETVVKNETERIMAQREYDQLATMYSALTNCTPAELRRTIATVSPDNLLQQLLQDQNSEAQKFVTARHDYGPDHAMVRGIQDKLSLLNTQVTDRVDGIVNGLKLKAESQKAAVDRLTSEVYRARTNDARQAEIRRPYQQIKRDLETALGVRERLYGRVWQEKVDQAMPREAIVEIIDKAEAIDRPVKPNKALNIFIGVVIGLAIGIGLAFFIEYLDTSVKTIDDVERALQAPVLGVIPQNVGYLISEGPDSPHAEAYRVLRTNIMFSQKDPKLNTITVVSGGAGEGKSTTIFNLATVFAQNGSRVLVVDSDLRRPSIHKILKISNSIGLTNFLLKQNTLEEVIQTTPLATLDFLPSGKLPSSSMGVLSSAQMKDLIRDLKRRYDYVFFDSPPIMGVSDASILASEVDCVLQVIQYRRYPQPMTIRAKQMIEKVGGNLLGIVLNNINMASDENYYYYSGYYYDYYSKSEDSKSDAEDSEGKPSDRENAGVGIKPKY